MARPGPPSRLEPVDGRKSSATRQALVDAAIETLQEDGFAGASARSIAKRAGCNQSLVFYHYGSVVNLLLAALDAVSTRRFETYRARVATAGSPAELVVVAREIFREDLDAGFVTVLVEMIAGAATTPDLGPEVVARIAPWTDFARQAIDTTLADSPLAALVPAGEAARGVVALYLGLELLSHLDGDRSAALALFERAEQLARLLPLLDHLGPSGKGSAHRG